MDSHGKDTTEEKSKDVFRLNNEEKHTESVEIEKRLKKIRDFLCAGEEVLFVDSKVSSSWNQHILYSQFQLRFNTALSDGIS